MVYTVPMAQTSPRRFQALWIAAAIGVVLVTQLVGAVFPLQVSGSTLDGAFYLRLYGVQVLAAALLGCLQAMLLAVHRRRVRGWAAATVLGVGAKIILRHFSGNQVLGWAMFFQNETLFIAVLGAVWAVTEAVSQGAAQALALWGRRWRPETVLWLSGLVLAHLLAAAVRPLLSVVAGQTPTVLLFIGYASVLLDTLIVAAGTAWLLDRIVFRGPEQHI